MTSGIAGVLSAGGPAGTPDTKALPGVPTDLAVHLARLPLLADLVAIDRIAAETRAPVLDVSQAYVALGSELHLTAIKAKAQALQLADDSDAIAMGEAVQQLNAAHAQFTRASLSADPSKPDFASVRTLLAQLARDDGITVSRLVVAATRLRDVAVPGQKVR